MGKLTISMAIFNSYVKLPEGIFDKNLAPYPICHGIFGWFHRFSHIFIHIIILLKVKSAICGQNHSSPINFSISFGMMAIPPKLNHSGRLRPKAVWTYAFGGLGLAVSIRKGIKSTVVQGSRMFIQEIHYNVYYINNIIELCGFRNVLEKDYLAACSKEWNVLQSIHWLSGQYHKAYGECLENIGGISLKKHIGRVSTIFLGIYAYT